MDYFISTTSLLGNRSSNQDKVGVAEKKDAVLLVLADGMSGHAGGKLASETFVKSVSQSFHASQFPHPIPKKFLREIITIANQDVLDVGARQNPPQQPRTTCVVALIQQGHAWWAHIGDSRLYLLRNGTTNIQTTDHSKVAELFSRGLISKEERQKHPERHIITRCIGTPNIRPMPTVSDKTELQHDDVLLLCTDGLWGALPEEELLQYMDNNHIESALEELAIKAETATYPHSDNVSAVALRWNSLKGHKHIREEAADDDFNDLGDDLDAINQAVQKLQGKG